MKDFSSDKKRATRDAVPSALIDLFKEGEDLVVLDADLCESTKTVGFKKVFPFRFFDCGIAECNMIGVACGLSAMGKVVFAASFSVFVAGRAFEQIRNSVCHNELNVKIIGSHCGFSASEDGSTHQSVEDIAILRAIPNITIISPCDFIETYAAIKSSAKHKGPVYIRTSKFLVEDVNDNSYLKDFKIGKGVVLKKGSCVCLFATGIEVMFCLKVAKMLEEEKISTMVVNIHTIKPLDEELIIDIAKNVQFLFSVEEHSKIGGLGDAIASVLVQNYPKNLTKIAIEDLFGESGSAEQLLNKHRLDVNGIYDVVRKSVFKFS